jgi:hypothetical protein
MPSKSKTSRLMECLGQEQLSSQQLSELLCQALANTRQFNNCLKWAERQPSGWEDDENLALSRLLFGGLMEEYGQAIFSSPTKTACWEKAVSQHFWRIQVLVGADLAIETYIKYEVEHNLPTSLTFLIGDRNACMSPACRGFRDSLRDVMDDFNLNHIDWTQLQREVTQTTKRFDSRYPKHRQHCFDCQQMLVNAKSGLVD